MRLKAVHERQLKRKMRTQENEEETNFILKLKKVKKEPETRDEDEDNRASDERKVADDAAASDDERRQEDEEQFPRSETPSFSSVELERDLDASSQSREINPMFDRDEEEYSDCNIKIEFVEPEAASSPRSRSGSSDFFGFSEISGTVTPTENGSKSDLALTKVFEMAPLREQYHEEQNQQQQNQDLQEHHQQICLNLSEHNYARRPDCMIETVGSEDGSDFLGDSVVR